MAGKKLPQGIDQLPSGKYRSRLVVDGIQHTIGTFHTLGDARAALDIARAEKARGTFEPPSVRRKRLNAEREARQAGRQGQNLRRIERRRRSHRLPAPLLRGGSLGGGPFCSFIGLDGSAATLRDDLDQGDAAGIHEAV